ncbi:MAG TPA: AraC family transcriptional regulator [Bradyrhizobium sp.]|nr:AraC family transcriptional regulator [Bradyrhizobium sp.]
MLRHDRESIICEQHCRESDLFFINANIGCRKHAMASDALAPLQAPRLFRCADVDEFRSLVRDLSVDFTPLARSIAAEHAILSLPGCEVNLTRSFPRIVDARLADGCTAVALSMDDGVPIRFNGVERDDGVIAIGGSGAIYSAVETAPREYASIIFRPEVTGRGWPQTGASFHVFEASRPAFLGLRRLVRKIFASASEIGGLPGTANVATVMRECLLAAIDGAVAGFVPARWTSQANSSRQFRLFRDIEEALAGHLGEVIYSEELAARVGVSVRTMHDAVQRYRGMSLHRYLRLRRLWLVRRQLIAGAESVKAAALAYGFWHLSDFSQAYRQQFDETPSETLARSRRRAS